MAPDKSTHPMSRRTVLVLGASAVGSAAAGAVIAKDGMLTAPVQSITGELPWREGQTDAPDPSTGKFFTAAEAAFITAAVDRLIPKDETGPSASEADVPTFLDHQLAGPYGQGQHFYLNGPWSDSGTESQGYQSRFTPADLYRHAIAEIEAYVGKANSGKTFKDLKADEQDKLLKEMESGDLKLEGPVKSKAFFTMFLQNVKEGYFSDPIYGGNKDGSAWKMIGFPGAHYDYSPWVTKYNEPVPVKPVGLRGRADWSRS
jgi:gluconate 2-dehydrogenase gamma chain